MAMKDHDFPEVDIRLPTSRELQRFVKRSWLRSFGPSRNTRDGAERRWLKLGRHRLDMREWQKMYARHVDDLIKSSTVIVAVNSSNRAIAFAVYEPGDARLHFLYVDPKHRGQGVGTRLKETVEQGRSMTYTHLTRGDDNAPRRPVQTLVARHH